jgi:hypothetical protein
MPLAEKAHCPAPGAVAAACRNYWAATQPQSLAKAGAALISEGIALLSQGVRTRQSSSMRADADTRAWATRSRRTFRLQCASRRDTSSENAPLHRSRKSIWKRFWAALSGAAS